MSSGVTAVHQLPIWKLLQAAAWLQKLICFYYAVLIYVVFTTEKCTHHIKCLRVDEVNKDLLCAFITMSNNQCFAHLTSSQYVFVSSLFIIGKLKRPETIHEKQSEREPFSQLLHICCVYLPYPLLVPSSLYITGEHTVTLVPHCLAGFFSVHVCLPEIPVPVYDAKRHACIFQLQQCH